MKKVDYSKGYIRCADVEVDAPVSFKLNGITVPIEHSKVFRLVDDTPDYLPYELVHLGFRKADILSSTYKCNFLGADNKQ